MSFSLDQKNSKRYRLSLLVLSLTFVFLLSCVSIGETNPVITNSAALVGVNEKSSGETFNNELASCQQVPTMSQLSNSEQGIDPENITFLNWNLFKGNGDNWQVDLSNFAKSHHVMTIQEAMLSDEMTMLLDDHDFNWVMNTAFYLKGVAAGVMNVSSFEARHSCGFKTNEPITRIPKSTLISYYSIDGSDKKLLVANIHGINFTLGMQRYREQLNTLYQEIKSHEGPMIVAGDFNSWSNKRLAEVSTLVELLSLSELEYSVNHKTHIFGNAIDHVFYRELEVLNHQVQQVSSSDHNPISVNFKYREYSL